MLCRLPILLSLLAVLTYVASDEVGHYEESWPDPPGFRLFLYHARIETIGGRSSCSGAIVDEQHIVTAASCLAYRTGSFVNLPINVTVGKDDAALNTLVVEAVEAYVPKSYFNLLGAGADIGVLKLKRPLHFTGSMSTIYPLELPSDLGTYEGENVTITGYGWNWLKVIRNETTGQLKKIGGADNDLRFAKAKVLARQECQPTGLPQNFICAKSEQLSEKTIEGVCSGDIGGPVVKSGKTLVGVVAYTPIGCHVESKSVAVYTRVGHYKSFIKNVLAGVPDYETASIKLPSSSK